MDVGEQWFEIYHTIPQNRWELVCLPHPDWIPDMNFHSFRVLHDLGGLLSAAKIPFSPTIVPPRSMVSILQNLNEGKITGGSAKKLLAMVFGGDERDVDTIIKQEDLSLQHLSREEYVMMAQALLEKDPKIVKQIQKAKQLGKLKFFVGQMMRQGSGKVEAQMAEAVLKELLGLD